MWRNLVGALFLFPLLSSCQGMPSVAAQSAVSEPDAIGPRLSDGPGRDSGDLPTRVIDFDTLPDLDAIIPRLGKKRVVFIGEHHTRFADHLNQLAIIEGLYRQGRELAIGMEFFQQPFQDLLDDFIAGAIDESALLAQTEYYDRWRYDYGLYRPILHFARDRGIPLIALNIASEVVEKVSKTGWEGLSAVEQAQVPDVIDRTNQDYEARLREVFRHHPRPHTKDARGDGHTDATDKHLPSHPHDASLPIDPHADRDAAGFRRFVDIQLLWDESMAERAARYLAEHPARTLVVLAGSGHLAYGHGIPDRVRRRVSVDTAIVLPAHAIADDRASGPNEAADIADFLLVSGNRALPPPGVLGVMLETNDEGVLIEAFTAQSAARMAGLETGDRLVEIDGRPIGTLGDVKLALWDKRPGDRVSVDIHRIGRFMGGRAMRFDVALK